jgi:hypothetical protein
MIDDTYKNALMNLNRHQIYKIEWMDKNENVVDEITTDTLEGSISIERQNGARRSCNLTLDNSTGIYAPNKDGLIYLNKKFKLSSGLLIDGVEVFPPECVQGVFNLGNPVVNSSPASETLSIEGYDNFALLNGTIDGAFHELTIINRGEPISEVIRTIATSAGLIQSPLVYLINENTAYTMSKEPGSTYEEILTDIALMISYDVYFDVMGRLNFRPQPDELYLSPLWVFDKTLDPFMSYSHNYNYLDVKNNILVYGENINGEQMKATAQDNSIFSPTSIDRIGMRTKVITDTLIATQELARERAAFELKSSITPYEYIDISCLNIDFLKEGDIIILNDEANGVYYERYIINQINRGLKFDDAMSITAYKVREAAAGV